MVVLGLWIENTEQELLLQAERLPRLAYRSFRDNGAINSGGQPTYLG